MISKWSELKTKAIEIRKRGVSIRKIEKRLKIPRSTLSGWFKDIQLTSTQKQKLIDDGKLALIKARKKAVIWHNNQKKSRLNEAKKQALKTLSHINTNDNYATELALAMLYLGEGAKKGSTTLGSSSVLILKFYIKCLTKLYNLDRLRFRYDLHLRSDQKPNELMQYWSKALNVPLKNFSAYKDKRTVKSKTYPNYKGVCVIGCGHVAIQRKIMYLSEEFCKLISYRGG